MAKENQKSQGVNDKFNYLKEILAGQKKVAVAYSGGVDSAFLLKIAKETLGDQVLAVTVHANSFPSRELQEAREFCEREGIQHIVCDFDELQLPGFAQNPPNRCYLCKRALLGKIMEIARERQILHVAEGSNVDDMADYRPGMQAIAELGVLSPLRDAGLTKEEIRCLSREWGLAAWDKPSFACLSSRFPYGEVITREKLRMVEQAEQFLWEMGFSQMRVRIHGKVARLEIYQGEIFRLLSEEVRLKIAARLKSIGFSYVALDLEGYRMGSMNELLKN